MNEIELSDLQKQVYETVLKGLCSIAELQRIKGYAIEGLCGKPTALNNIKKEIFLINLRDRLSRRIIK